MSVIETTAAGTPKALPTAAEQAGRFISRVLPWPEENASGYCNLHWMVLDHNTNKRFMAGRAFTTVGDLVGFAEWLAPKNNDVYFCLSRQKERGAPTTSGKGFKAIRSQDNAVALRAIWLDVDVKDPPKGYATLGEAIDAVADFCRKANMPAPTALVASGGGLHAYWISNVPLTPNEWRTYAEGLKTAAMGANLRCDAGVTIDCARILRVPRTFNYKTTPPRPVRLLRLDDSDVNFATRLAHLKALVPSYNASTTVVDKAAGARPLGLVEKDFPPLPREPIAKECAFISDAMRTGGKDYTEPMWMLTTLSAVFMEDGHVTAHAMACGHPEYTYETTEEMWQRKLKDAERGIGWPSCKAIEAAGCKACATCKHRSKNKSPLHLGAATPPKPILNAGETISSNANRWPDGVDRHGIPRTGYANTLAAFRELRIKFTYDAFRQKEFTNGHKIETLNGELSDRAVTMLRDQIRSECGFWPTKEITREAITAVCLRNQNNPVTDYFDRLKWDGTPRLDNLLHTYLGADDTPLNAAFGRKLMCAIVRRSKQPGCKFDHQLVLQGNQGVRKSTFCEDLAVFPDLYTDAGDLAATVKEQMEVSVGKQIIEYPEHAGFNQKIRERNKAALSRKIDRARMAYAHYAVDAPRAGVSIATTNLGNYLNDPTGERRYWHVRVSKYDQQAFLRDKDQLYAEAVVREPYEKLWLDTSDLVEAHDAIVATAKEPNALVEDLTDLNGEIWETGRVKTQGGWVIHREERASNMEARLKLGIIGADVVRLRDLSRRISDAMLTLGWAKAAGTLVCRHGGKPEGGYRRPIPDDYEPDPPLVDGAGAPLLDGVGASLNEQGGTGEDEPYTAPQSGNLQPRSGPSMGIDKGPESPEPTEPSKNILLPNCQRPV